jgi:uncharacterized Zn ribbon protein
MAGGEMMAKPLKEPSPPCPNCGSKYTVSLTMRNCYCCTKCLCAFTEQAAEYIAPELQGEINYIVAVKLQEWGV